MKVTVIGEWGGFPKANGASSGYLVEAEGFHLLVDCGSAVLSKLQHYIPVEQLDAVIISHYHHDHIADIGPLQHARLVKHYLGAKQATLPIYGHPFDDVNFARLTDSPYTEGVAYDPDETLQIGPFTVTFMQTEHSVPCYAMRISDREANTIVYTADSAYKDEFIPFSRKVNLLICESNFYAHMNGKEAGHMTSTEAATIAIEANVDTLLLTHLPHFGNIHDLTKQAQSIYKGSTILAKEGWIWTSDS